jgi:hypothetical protein
MRATPSCCRRNLAAVLRAADGPRFGLLYSGRRCCQCFANTSAVRPVRPRLTIITSWRSKRSDNALFSASAIVGARLGTETMVHTPIKRLLNGRGENRTGGEQSRADTESMRGRGGLRLLLFRLVRWTSTQSDCLGGVLGSLRRIPYQ